MMMSACKEMLSSTTAGEMRREPARADVCPLSGERGTVLHITPSIGGGGAEAMLCNLVAYFRGGQWRSTVVSVDGRAWPERAGQLRSVCESYCDLAAPAFLRPGVLWRLRRIIRQVRPDVVQTWMHHADLLGGITARLAGVKRIVWGIHCREIHRNPGDSDLKMAAFRRALGLASKFVPSRIVSCSLAAIDDHAKLGYPRSRMEWIPNGIAADRFVVNPQAGLAVRDELGIPGDAWVIGFVGRCHEMKNLPLLFAAFGQLQRRAPGVWLVLCGGSEVELDEPSLTALEGMADRSRIRFVPFRVDIENLYPAFSLFTLSSRTEACPMSVLEAMACGVPCVTTDVGDCARLIGDTGTVVRSGDAEALAAAWEKFLTMPIQARVELGLRARSRVEQKFTIGRAAAKYETLYNELIGR